MAIYELNININESGDVEAQGGEATQAKTTNKKQNPADPQQQEQDKNISTRAVVGGAVGLVTFGANVYKQSVSINSGDQNQVNKTNFVVDKGTKLAGIGIAFAFNPALGIVALGGAILSEVVSYSTNQIAFNRQVQDEQIAIGTINERRGIAFNRSGR